MKTLRSSRLGASLWRFFGQLGADRSGNIAMILGLSVIPLTFVIGFGIDYSRSEKLQTKLNAAADAAALAAVDPTMILQSDDASRNAANNMFNSQVSGRPRSPTPPRLKTCSAGFWVSRR